MKIRIIGDGAISIYVQKAALERGHEIPPWFCERNICQGAAKNHSARFVWTI